MRELLRRTYQASELVTRYPLTFDNDNKRLVFARCDGAGCTGLLDVTRWAVAALPEHIPEASPDISCVPGRFDYAGPSDGVWHVNFADSDLFFGYGTSLFAQDELQCAEHPALAAVREALIRDGHPALTEDDHGPTPVLVMNVERRCAIETSPGVGRPNGLYGNNFAASSAEVVRDAVEVLRPAPRSHILAIAAPTQGRGRYRADEIERITITAFTGFAAAVRETARRWPGLPTEIRTGFWGCGAFGGNRRLLTLLQLFAARLAGVTRVRFYAFDNAGRAEYDAAAYTLARIADNATVAEVLARVDAEAYVWCRGNGT